MVEVLEMVAVVVALGITKQAAVNLYRAFNKPTDDELEDDYDD